MKRAGQVLLVAGLVLFLSSALLGASAGAAPGDLTCYLVADDGGGDGTDSGAEDLLTRVDPGDSDPATNETNVGTGTESFGIEAVAFRPGTETLYAVDEDQLGTLDLTTGTFTASPNPVGTGNGAAGEITFDNIDGISFDPDGGALYAVQRQRGEPPDLLLQIDRVTGAHVADAFGAGVDYVVVEPSGALANIDDIAFVPSSTLYAIANDEGNDDRLVTIDPATGEVTDVGATGADDMEGLTSTPTGALLGTTGKNGSIPDSLWDIDAATGAASNPRPVDNGADYESLGCIAEAAQPSPSPSPSVSPTETVAPSPSVKPGQFIPETGPADSVQALGILGVALLSLGIAVVWIATPMRDPDALG